MGSERNVNDPLKPVLFAFWSNSAAIVNLPFNLAGVSLLNLNMKKKGRHRYAYDKNLAEYKS